MSNLLNPDTMQYIRSDNIYPDHTDWIVNPDLSSVAGIDKKYWKIVDGAVVEMTRAEKDAVDAEALPAEITAKRITLNSQTKNFIYTRYTDETQKSLIMHKCIATEESYTNRTSAVRLAFDWIDSVTGAYYAADDLAEAAVSLAELSAISIDFDALAATDPEVDLKVVRLIMD